MLLAGAGVEPANRSGYPMSARIITNPAITSKMPRLMMSSASKRQPVRFSHLFGPFWTARCTFFITISPWLNKKTRPCSVLNMDRVYNPQSGFEKTAIKSTLLKKETVKNFLFPS